MTRLPLAILLASMLLHNLVFAQSADALFAPGEALRERAEAANAALLAPRDYLKGVQALERARAEGCGDSRPVANNLTAEGRARNRLIDVHILAQN